MTTQRDPDPYVLYTVVRRSLKLSVGKAVAQGQHAAHYVVRAGERANADTHPSRDEIMLVTARQPLTAEEQERLDGHRAANKLRRERGRHYRAWDEGEHAKVVLGATDAEFAQVVAENPFHFSVIDLGYTQVPPDTLTVLGLWPMRKSQASATVKTLRPL